MQWCPKIDKYQVWLCHIRQTCLGKIYQININQIWSPCLKAFVPKITLEAIDPRIGRVRKIPWGPSHHRGGAGNRRFWRESLFPLQGRSKNKSTSTSCLEDLAQGGREGGQTCRLLSLLLRLLHLGRQVHLLGRPLCEAGSQRPGNWNQADEGNTRQLWIYPILPQNVFLTCLINIRPWCARDSKWSAVDAAGMCVRFFFNKIIFILLIWSQRVWCLTTNDFAQVLDWNLPSIEFYQNRGIALKTHG